MSSKAIAYKFLLIVSLILYISSVSQPWITDYSRGWVPTPRVPTAKFWSFQVVRETSQEGRLVDSWVSRFQDYWFAYDYASGSNLYQTWLLVFAFQILGVFAAVATLVKEKVRGRPLPAVLTMTCFAFSLVLCYSQYLKQCEAVEGLMGLSPSVNLDIGFSLALISVILWTVPLWFDRLTKRRVPSLILLLTTTAFQTMIFTAGLAYFVKFWVRMDGGGVSSMLKKQW